MGLRIELVPLNEPAHRRLQTFVAFLWASIFLYGGPVGVIALCYLLRTQFWWISLLYFAWVWFDRKTPSHGGRRLEWLRRSWLFKSYRDYFPISLVKTADLDPNEKYIMGYHPHGVMGCGTANFYSDATGFSEKFPGITPYIMAVRILLWMPIVREWMMSLGACDVSRESIDYLLEKNGSAVVILIGGAKESLEPAPSQTRLVLKDRKGFVKMALRHGAHLVPTFTFGETELFRPLCGPESRMRRFQRLFLKYTMIPPVLFRGRGFFIYTFGIIPRRHRLVTVVGRPIIVERQEDPSQATIDELHQRYMRELNALFEQHKPVYGLENQSIEFIH